VESIDLPTGQRGVGIILMYNHKSEASIDRKTNGVELPGSQHGGHRHAA